MKDDPGPCTCDMRWVPLNPASAPLVPLWEIPDGCESSMLLLFIREIKLFSNSMPVWLFPWEKPWSECTVATVSRTNSPQLWDTEDSSSTTAVICCAALWPTYLLTILLASSAQLDGLLGDPLAKL